MSESGSRFWSFSLAVYRGASVQAECLDLQDRHGVNVNLLLFCAYVGAAHGAVLPDAELRAARALVSAWHDEVVGRLRAARRALKPFAAASSPGVSAAELRSTVKTAELEAERIEQAMLEEWSAGPLEAWPRAAPEAAITANLRSLFVLSGDAPRPPEMPSHLVAASLAVASPM